MLLSNTMKLYKVTCRGMRSAGGSGVVDGLAYVVAESLSDAYKRVKDYLEEKELGTANSRELDVIELIAEETDYPRCGYRLFVQRIA